MSGLKIGIWYFIKCGVKVRMFRAGLEPFQEMPHYPYWQLEVQVKGNTNKYSHDLYMFFPAASLITVPTLSAYNGEIFSTPLVFDLIYKGRDEPRLVIC